MKKIVYADNIEITPQGRVVKRVGFKTLRGFITWVKKTNKRCRKDNWGGLYTFELPMKP
jgi:hypothetical protein